MKHNLYLLYKHILARKKDYLFSVIRSVVSFILLVVISLLIITLISVPTLISTIFKDPILMKSLSQNQIYNLINTFLSENAFSTYRLVCGLLIPIAIIKKVYHFKINENIERKTYPLLTIGFNAGIIGIVFVGGESGIVVLYIGFLLFILTILDIKKYYKDYGKIKTNNIIKWKVNFGSLFL